MTTWLQTLSSNNGSYEILAAVAIIRGSSVWAVDANPLARLSCSLELPLQRASPWAGGNPFSRDRDFTELQNSEVRALLVMCQVCCV